VAHLLGLLSEIAHMTLDACVVDQLGVLRQPDLLQAAFEGTVPDPLSEGQMLRLKNSTFLCV
jgi:hypothetical protein